MSEENIENITKSHSTLAPTFVGHDVLPDLNFNGHCLKNTKKPIPKNIINLYVSYTVKP